MGRKWLDNYGKQENYNDSKTYFPSEFEGLGYSVSGRNYSPSWGGQFQTGGIVTNEWEGEDVSKNLLPHNQIKTSEINYLKDWLNSPMANKIANQRNNKNAKQNINARLERLSDKNLNIKTVEEIKDKGNSFDKRRLKGFENPNLQGRSYTSPGHSYGDIITRSSVPKNVFVHEGSHVSTGGNTLLPENDITDILSRVKDDSGTYYSNPTEVQARLNVFRKELKESGIVDPFKTPVTKQQLKTFLNKYKSPTDKSNKPLLETNSAELINTVKSEDDVLWMLNNIVNNQNNELIPIAQNGRNLKRLLYENNKKDTNSFINYTQKRNIDPIREIKKDVDIIQTIQKKYNISRKKAAEIKQKLEVENAIKNPPPNPYEIKPSEDQSFLSKSWEVLTNPATAASYWLNDQRIPDHFSKGERNNLEYATDLVNPFGIIDSGKNAIKETYNIPKNIVQGKYEELPQNLLNLGVNTLTIIPALKELKGVKPNQVKRVLSDATEYITTNTPLKNTYKYNPWAFKPSSEMGYRMLGKEGFNDALETGVLRAKPSPNQPTNGGISLARNTNRNPNTGKLQGALDRPYFADGFIDERYASDYMAAVNKVENNLVPIPTHKGIAPSTPTNIPIENAQFYKKHWLQGYKPVKVPESRTYNKFSNSNFKSEINWGNWNKEIPDNPQLMQEYNAIEQTSKANGTWMKNPDGSKFKGTPEQFVQQNSQNFKRAFGDTPNIAYRGQTHPTETIGGGNRGYDEGISYLGDKDQALTYAETWKHPRHSGKIYQPGVSDPNAPALYELLYPNSTNTKIITHSEPRNWQKLIDNDVASQMDETYLKFRGKSDKGEQFVNTDDIGEFVAKNNLDHAYISNIMDYARKPSRKFFNLLPGKNVGNTVIMNSKPGNYLKSRWYNNGMFDMTNPNIYKTLVPGAIGLGALQQKKNGGVIKDNTGYWNPDNWGKVVEIDSNDITMKGVNQPLLGISDEGDIQYMKPGKDYKFKGKKVREFPIAKNGINNLDENSLQQLDQLTNFTNYNKLSNGGWLDKF